MIIIQQIRYIGGLIMLGVFLFLLMTQGAIVHQVFGQTLAPLPTLIDNTIESTNTQALEDEKQSIQETTVKTVEDTNTGEILDTTREQLENTSDNSLSSDSTNSTVQTTQVVEPTQNSKTQLRSIQEIQAEVHPASIFSPGINPAEKCEFKEGNIYLCNQQTIIFYRKGEVPNQAVEIAIEDARDIYNRVLGAINTCTNLPRHITSMNGCNVDSATNYVCAGESEYRIATFNKGTIVAIYIDTEPVSESENFLKVNDEVLESHEELPGKVEEKVGEVNSELPGVRVNTISSSISALPERCRNAGALTERQCATFLDQASIPQLCKDSHINTVEGCNRYMLDREVDNVAVSGTPTEVTEGLPRKCEILGISDVVKCNEVLAESSVQAECRDAGILSRESCNQYLEEQYKKSIYASCDEGEEVCLEKALDEFSAKTVCVGLPKEACRDVLREQHLGFWLAKKDEIEKNAKIAKQLSGSPVLSVKRLDREEQEVIRKTITNDRSLYVYPAKGSVVVTEENELDSAPPALLILDDDGDGLSNEFEKRLGTDPTRKDTDDDGFDDRMELQNGFNPLGDGEKQYGFWPVDGAMLYELPLDQPLISEAAIDENLIVEPIVNVHETTEHPVNTLSGKGPGNSLLTVYVYSALPMVLTVQTDKDGNWEYQLEESLADGEHEVFVALVDTFGSISKKSNSLTFFVQEAQAVDADEFFNFQTATAPSSTEPINQFSRYYIYGAITLIAFALIIAIFFIWNSRAKDDTFPDLDDDDIPHV